MREARKPAPANSVLFRQYVNGFYLGPLGIPVEAVLIIIAHFLAKKYSE